jgi:hypothetical protein
MNILIRITSLSRIFRQRCNIETDENAARIVKPLDASLDGAVWSDARQRAGVPEVRANRIAAHGRANHVVYVSCAVPAVPKIERAGKTTRKAIICI